MSTEWAFFRTADGRQDVEAMRSGIVAGLKEAAVPVTLHEGLTEYVLHGRPTGHFLRACLDNDLREACTRADLQNQARLYNIVFFLYNWAPGECWGSPEKHSAWVTKRGFLGPNAENWVDTVR